MQCGSLSDDDEDDDYNSNDRNKTDDCKSVDKNKADDNKNDDRMSASRAGSLQSAESCELCHITLRDEGREALSLDVESQHILQIP